HQRTQTRASAGHSIPGRPCRRRRRGGSARGPGGGPPGRLGSGRLRHQPLGLARQAARRRHRGRRSRVDAGRGRHFGHPPGQCAGTPVPGRALRRAAAGHLGRLRRLARHRGLGRRSGLGRFGAAMVSLAGVGTAYPPGCTQQELWDGFFSTHYSGVQRALAQRIFRNSGVTTRHAAVNPLLEDASRWPTSRRMQRYLTEAVPLGKAALAEALSAAALDPDDVGLFAVCSCTGYATPGLDILLARDLGMSSSTQRVFIGHMGCYAALPGLGVVSDFVTARDRPAVLLCVELTSLHVQPPAADAEQIVSHALFADAAAAAVVLPEQPSGGSYAIIEIASATDVTASDQMTWDVTDLGFRM